MGSEDLAAGATQDERVMAALAHASNVLPFWGLIGAIIIWAAQKNRSPFVRFQALQALAYQITGMIVWLSISACSMCASLALLPAMLLIAPEAWKSGGGTFPLPFFFPFGFFLPFACMMAVIWPVQLAYSAYGLVGAVQVLRGRDFRYAVVGRWLERNLDREPAETQR